MRLLLRRDAEPPALAHLVVVDPRLVLQLPRPHQLPEDALRLLAVLLEHLVGLHHVDVAVAARRPAVDARVHALERPDVERVAAQHRVVQHLFLHVDGRLVAARHEREELRLDVLDALRRIGAPLLLQLLERAIRVLEHFPEHVQQHGVRVVGAMHRVGQRRREDVVHRRLRVDPKAAHILHPLVRFEDVAVHDVVPNVLLIGADVDRAVLVDEPGDHRQLPLGVQRPARPERVRAAVQRVLVQRHRAAALGHFQLHVLPQRPAFGVLLRSAGVLRVQLLEVVDRLRAFVHRTSREPEVGRVGHVALQLVGLLHRGAPPAFGHRACLAGAENLQLLAHGLGPELVVRVRAVVDQLPPAVRHDLGARRVVELLQAPAELLAPQLLVLRPGVLHRVEHVVADLAVELLARKLGHRLVGRAAVALLLHVAVRAGEVALGSANRQQPEQLELRDGARALGQVGGRLGVRDRARAHRQVGEHHIHHQDAHGPRAAVCGEKVG